MSEEGDARVEAFVTAMAAEVEWLKDVCARQAKEIERLRDAVDTLNSLNDGNVARMQAEIDRLRVLAGEPAPQDVEGEDDGG